MKILRGAMNRILILSLLYSLNCRERQTVKILLFIFMKAKNVLYKFIWLRFNRYKGVIFICTSDLEK